jgi:undecaprenyl-phosphate 4-deoxy-4-formamido-L-arabinose transferase
MNKNDLASISIVVPVYNSEKTLPMLVDRLGTVLPRIARDYEILLVNDCSTDDSWSVISKLVKKIDRVNGMNLMRNYGQHNALLAGIRAAKYELIVTLDDDLQNPPEEIPTLVKKLNKGFDVVYGTPERGQHGLWRNLASQLTKLTLQNAMGAETARKVSAFRAFRAKVRDAFTHYQGTFVSIDVLLTWGTTQFTTVQVRHDPRKIGKSNYTLRKLIIHAINMMTGFSILPLQLASLMGFILTLFGLAVFIYVIGRYFIQGSSVPGFPFLASIIAIFSGAQLFALGIIGEYLARMHFRMMARPQYIIRSVTEPDGN